MPAQAPTRAIAAGDVSLPVVAWLSQHGCKISACAGLTIIELPGEDEAIFENGPYPWAYTISFHDGFGDQASHGVGIELDVLWCVDARQTSVTLRAI